MLISPIKYNKLKRAIVIISGHIFHVLKPFLLSFPSHNSFKNKKSSLNLFLFLEELNSEDFLMASFFN